MSNIAKCTYKRKSWYQMIKNVLFIEKRKEKTITILYTARKCYTSRDFVIAAPFRQSVGNTFKILPGDDTSEKKDVAVAGDELGDVFDGDPVEVTSLSRFRGIMLNDGICCSLRLKYSKVSAGRSTDS